MVLSGPSRKAPSTGKLTRFVRFIEQPVKLSPLSYQHPLSTFGLSSFVMPLASGEPHPSSAPLSFVGIGPGAWPVASFTT